MKSILILGAGLMQRPSIMACKELGYRAVVVDADEKAVCVPLADKFSKIDLKAKEEILEFAKKIPDLSAVFTAGTDFSASVSYVASNLNLPCHPYEAAMNASNKILMRSCFEKNGVPSPKFIKISEDDFQSLDYASLSSKLESEILVVKPCDNMGGRGCRMIRSEDEFVSACKDAVENSRTKTAILEQYMEGREFSIDALVFDGTFTVTGFAERHIKYPPYFIEVGHTMPAVIPNEMHDQLISVFALGAKSLGLTHGAAKADIKFTEKGPMIGEIAARLSGGYMSGWTYPYASGLDLTKEALTVATGSSPVELLMRRECVEFTKTELTKNAEEPYDLFEVPCTQTSAERAWISIPGVVESVQNLSDKSQKNSVQDFLPRATIYGGCTVDFPRNNVQKCGNVITASSSHEKAMEDAQKAVSNMLIRLRPNQAQTDSFLSGITSPDEKGFPPSAYDVSDEFMSGFCGHIPENMKFTDFFGEIFDEFDSQKDWNYLTLNETLLKLDEIFPKHKSIETKKFASALVRGGLQGAVYILNS